jgi:1A family penicillin-binding protein
VPAAVKWRGYADVAVIGAVIDNKYCSSMKKMKKLKKIFAVISAAVLILLAAAAGALFYFSKDLPTVEQITSRQISQSTKIYDRTGSILLYEISNGQQRTVVPFDAIPKYLKDATIAIEDENFYNEPAFDLKAILRALLANLTSGRIIQGGSTITQQLAKNAFLTPEQTLSRKIKELLLAIRLNRYYSKDQILSFYLNEIPYGPTIYGIESASEAYFAKPVSDLNLAESAILAAIPKAPTYYSPWGNHVKDLLSRQKLVLEKMLELKKITPEQFNEATKTKVSFAPQNKGILAPHFVLAVQDYLAQKYGEDTVRAGGLRVITTLNWDMQQLAEHVVADGAAQNEKLYNGKNAALVAEDPKTGQILAMVGSRNYFDTKNEGNFNVATQGLRQPGSALKPFAYLTAFQKGYTPDAVVFDVPTEFAANNPACPPAPDFTNDNKECFHPENFDGQFRGPVSLRNALAQSINIPSVKVLYLAGLSDTVKNAYNFGLTTLTSPNLYGLSLVLGGGAVKLIDLTGAYSVLAQDGIKHEQSMVLEVRDSSGRVLESYKDQSSRVAGQEEVRLVNNILSDANARSGLFQNSLYMTVFQDRDVALKTGTSNDYRDAWAIGYTPSLVVGVWAGNNDNSPMQRHGSSILAAVPIWHSFMSGVINSLPLETFNRPEAQSPQKPILAGDYLYNKQIHTILFYVNRNDPNGPQPLNPWDDPQFTNWEFGALAWAKENLPDFKDYNQTPAETNNTIQNTNTNYPPIVVINEPQPGTFIQNQIHISAKITSLTQLNDIKVYLNNNVIQDLNAAGSPPEYDFNFSFTPPSLNQQNLLKIEAINKNNLAGSASVIVYSNK